MIESMVAVVNAAMRFTFQVSGRARSAMSGRSAVV
jgi:hypothetical protein